MTTATKTEPTIAIVTSGGLIQSVYVKGLGDAPLKVEILDCDEPSFPTDEETAEHEATCEKADDLAGSDKYRCVY